MNVFITGASGFIGSHLTHYLFNHHHEQGRIVTLVRDLIPCKWLAEALDRTIIVKGDITNLKLLKRVMNQYEINHVYHLAAQSIVKTAYKDVVGTYETNLMGTVKLLEACRQLDVDKILVQSTDKVYGNTQSATLESKLKPTEPYGSSKIAMDVAAQSFALTYGMKLVITRSCNCYGLDYNNRIIPNTVRACLRGESPIIYENDNSTRQYIYVEDLIRAMRWFLHNSLGAKPWIKNIGTDSILTQEEVVKKILEHFPNIKPKYVKKPELKEIKSQWMVPSVGYEPIFTFEGGIAKTIERFRWYGW